MYNTEKFLTLDMFLNLPDKILNVAKSPNSNYLSLLDENTCNKYFYVGLRKDLLNIINKFNEQKYSFSINDKNIISSSSLELKENKFTKNYSDRVFIFVQQKIESEKLTLNIYNKIISLSYKLTFAEAIYFINSFFAKIGEEAISEKLGISRTYLQKIKKSCLVKMYFEFIELIPSNI